MIVIDASVAAKTYLEEPDSAKADALFKGNEPLVAPALIRLEVAAALCRAAKRGVLTEEEAVSFCECWEKYLEDEVIMLIPDEKLLSEGVRLSITLKHPLQDCLYLAVASRYNATLLTADTRLFEHARGQGMPVQLLANYGMN